MRISAEVGCAWSLSTLLLLAAACDPQVGELYDGEALFRLQGSVISTDADLGVDPTAAIVWMSDDANAVVISPVNVQGDFPAKFVLTAFEPPPAIVRLPLKTLGLPDVTLATGLITAVDPDITPFYPNVLSYSPDGKRLPQVGPGETLLPEWDYTFFRGGAPAHLVAYLSGEVPAQARCLAGYRRGYNLLELRERTEEERAARNACRDRAEMEALLAFNAENGTSYAPDDVGTMSDEDERAVEYARKTKACELDCGIFKVDARLVAPGEPVTLQMQRDVEFVDWN